MIRQEFRNNVQKNLRATYMRQFLAFTCVICALACNGVTADDFVPFVIPAKPNAGSLIAAAALEPIGTDSDRLQAHGGHFYRGEKRVRLWGVNLSFGANLPRHEDAPFIAARLAAAGVNTVRCHHLDTARWPRGLWNAKDGKDISPEALDRLDFFIDQLARRGICVNINLHVGRAHSQYLGLPKTNRQYDKISNIFTPALIDAQKKFAREMLDRVNPYRKVRYADDPAVAFVEITNENSFFMWSSEETLRTLPTYYADILQKKFNTWLKQQYGSDEKLRQAWSGGAQPLGKNLLTDENSKSGNVPSGWQLEQHLGCKAVLRRQRYLSQDALRIDVDKSDKTEWHLQFKQAGLSVQGGEYYTVTFEAAAEEPRKLSCGVSQAHEPWQNLGLSRRVDLAQKWQTFRFGFVAKDDDDNARVSFAFGGGDVSFYLANVELCSGGRVGMGKGESIKNVGVVVFADNESPQRTTDRMRFLAETEKAYFDEMRNFIKKDLGCKALVTGTIVFGPLGLYAQSDMDFIDAHAYWQHPRFPGRPWDSGNWIVNQKPMTDYPAEATLFRLAAERLLDKPFTVSEYNHPAPLDSQAECVPMIASFAAAQDWDGVWLYTYSHSSDEWNREHMYSYFDIDTNPAKWGFMRAGAAIFLDRSIVPLNGFIFFGLRDSSDTLTSLAQSHLKHDGNMLSSLCELANMSRYDMLKGQILRSLTTTGYGHRDIIGPNAILHWLVEDGNGIFVVSSWGASVYIGHADRFEKATNGKVSVSGPEFVALTVTSLDGKSWISLDQSRTILVTACGRCENTGMKFSEDRRTVGREWGHGPVQIEAVEGTIMIPGNGWQCRALGPDGVAKTEVPVRSVDDRNYVDLLPSYKTMWYLLTRAGEN
jgi:hypothetical protein